MVETCDLCWDRGALVAVDPADRPAYAKKVRELLAPTSAILLVAIEYHVPPEKMTKKTTGPPFCLTAQDLYGDEFSIELLSEEKMPLSDMPPSLRQFGPVEKTYLLRRGASAAGTLLSVDWPRSLWAWFMAWIFRLLGLGAA